MISTRILTSAAILLMLMSSFSLAAIYKWTDEHGQVHYGSAPPSGSSAKRMGVSTHYSTPPAAKPKAETQASGSKEKKTAAATDKKDPYSKQQHDSLCKNARNDIATLDKGGRLRVKQADGSSAVMTDESRNKRQKTMQEMISKHCK